jgi:hypothetical protein
MFVMLCDIAVNTLGPYVPSPGPSPAPNSSMPYHYPSNDIVSGCIVIGIAIGVCCLVFSTMPHILESGWYNY